MTTRADVRRVVAVDWSGDRSAAGQRRKIWAGVWTAGGAGRVFGGSIDLESGKTHEEWLTWLAARVAETPGMVVGVDFCFSYPAWFVKEKGARTAPEFWNIVVEQAEHWLGCECEDARFWGRVGRFRTGKKPPEFCGEFGLRMLRQADIACKVQGKILDPSEAAKVKGIAPKSPFQIGGAGAVGTGTLRGIPLLPELVRGGFSIWPFHPTKLPMVVEIYPRLLTGVVKKGNSDARTEYLAEKQRNDAAYAALPPEVVEKARRGEDAFDALISVMKMAAKRDDFPQLPQSTDAVTLLEGAVWGAKELDVEEFAWDINGKD